MTKFIMKTRIYYLTITLVIIAITGSCKQFGSDYSLENDAYVKLGMPDYKKKWSGDDYSEANITLSTLLMEAPLSLPRKNSKKSSQVFKRIVNEENIAFVYDTAVPLKVRAFLIQHYPRIIGEAENLYSYKNKGKLAYREELLDINIFQLTIHDRMLELARIINESDDETLTGFKVGMQNVKNNYLRLIPQIVKKISDNKEFKTSETLQLSDALSRSLSANLIMLDRNEKTILIAEFNRTKDLTKSSQLKENLNNCIKLLSD